MNGDTFHPDKPSRKKVDQVGEIFVDEALSVEATAARARHANEHAIDDSVESVRSPDQDAALFDRMFGVDVIRDIAEIRNGIKRLTSESRFDYRRIVSEREYQSAREKGELKYSPQEIGLRPNQWDKEDLDFVIQTLRGEKIREYFWKISENFHYGIVASRHLEALVSLHQEEEMTRDLLQHTPLLIRGTWFAGKTEAAQTLSRNFGRENSLFITPMKRLTSGELESYIASSVARFIQDKTHDIAREHVSEGKGRQEIEEQIKLTKKPPVKFLNDWLAGRGEIALLVFD